MLIFPELKAELETLFFMPESEGKEFVINRYRDPGQNLRTTFDKIVIQAGLSKTLVPSDFLKRSSQSVVFFLKLFICFSHLWVGEITFDRPHNKR